MGQHSAEQLSGYSPLLQRWFDWILAGQAPEGLATQLHDDCVFWSPVVHTPQIGKPIVMAYLIAAGQALNEAAFRYVRIFDCGQMAVLEFETEMPDATRPILVNGIDMIQWNDDGLIVDFKVMVRPLKAVQRVHADMAAMLETMKGGD
ncbi:MAG: nuclear transport factor 2 family protein [Alphaproteobacteria bacterium]